jgi:hypothetical protein
MPTDIVVFDKLADLKRLSNEDAFKFLEGRFLEEKKRYITKMLHPETSSEETLQIKAIVNALTSLSPMALAEKTLKIQAKQLKAEHPEMWRTKK